MPNSMDAMTGLLIYLRHAGGGSALELWRKLEKLVVMLSNSTKRGGLAFKATQLADSEGHALEQSTV